MAGKKFVITGTLDSRRINGAMLQCVILKAGTLDSLERDEATDLIQKHGGKVCSSLNNIGSVG